jgi:hypothetical protein
VRKRRWLLLLRCAFVSRGIPHAASLRAIGFGLGCCRVTSTSKGRAGEGKGKRYGERGNQDLPGLGFLDPTRLELGELVICFGSRSAICENPHGGFREK